MDTGACAQGAARDKPVRFVLRRSMFTNRKIAFIGSGVMAEAMIAGLLRQGSATVDALIAAEPRPERLTEIVAHYGIDATPDNTIAVRHADVVVLSVKPQSLEKAMSGLRGAIKPDALVFSIVAGAPVEKISGGLNHQAVIRCMPNTPGQIGEGITVWTASPAVTEDQRRMA